MLRKKDLLIIFLFAFLLLFIIFGGWVFFSYYRISQEKKELAQEEDLIVDYRPQGSEYTRFKIKGLTQVYGLVLEKNDQEKTLVLRKKGGGERIIKLLPGTTFVMPERTGQEGTHLIEGDLWEYIYPRRTSIVAVCTDESCQETDDIFISRLAEDL